MLSFGAEKCAICGTPFGRSSPPAQASKDNEGISTLGDKGETDPNIPKVTMINKDSDQLSSHTSTPSQSETRNNEASSVSHKRNSSDDNCVTPEPKRSCMDHLQKENHSQTSAKQQSDSKAESSREDDASKSAPANNKPGDAPLQGSSTDVSNLGRKKMSDVSQKDPNSHVFGPPSNNTQTSPFNAGMADTRSGVSSQSEMCL